MANCNPVQLLIKAIAIITKLSAVTPSLLLYCYCDHCIITVLTILAFTVHRNEDKHRMHPNLKLDSVLLQYLRPEASVRNGDVHRGCRDFSGAGVRDHVFHLRRTGERVRFGEVLTEPQHGDVFSCYDIQNPLASRNILADLRHHVDTGPIALGELGRVDRRDNGNLKSWDAQVVPASKKK